MKKILAIVLAVVLLLPVMGTMGIPTLAMGENESYPLLYETYESEKALESITRAGSGKGTVTIADSGVNGSSGALSVSQTSANNYIDIRYPTSVQFAKGQMVEVSFWMKLKSDLKTDVSDANRISLIFYGSGTVTKVGDKTGIQVGDYFDGDGWKQYDYNGNLVKNQWIKISRTITWEDSMSIGGGATIGNITLKSVALRVGNVNGTNAVVDGKNLEYELDDFVIGFPKADADNKINYREDFNGNATTGNLDGRSEDCSPQYKKIVYTNSQVSEADGHIANKQANHALDGVKPEVGHVYKFSGWFRFDADDTATDFVAEQAELRLIFMGKDKNDVNFTGGNYPSFYTKPFAEGAWTYLEYYFYMDERLYTKNPGGYLYTRLCPIASYKGGELKHHRDHTIPGTYSFDNIKVEEVDAGSMELDSSVSVIRNFTEITQVVPGWNPAGSALEKITENGNSYLRATITSDSHGSVQKPYTFENGKKYRISFRAKLDNLADGVTQPITLIMDRKVSKVGSTDAYEVPNYQYVIGGNQVSSSSSPGANHPWQISNEWQTFTTIYETDFTVKSGMEETAPTVNPRSPNMYLYTYDAEGKVSPMNTVLCLDDFAVEEIPVPTVDNISFSREDDAVRVSYDYISATSEAENKDATLIRAFLKNGETETNIGTFSGNEAFVVPPVAVGKTIYFEVTPVDADGNIGYSAVKECDIVFDEAQKASMTVGEDKKSITWNVSAGIAESNGTSYRIGAAVYAGDFSMLFTDLEAYELADGVNKYGNTFSIPEGATSVKLFIWEANANAPLCKAVEMDLTK